MSRQKCHTVWGCQESCQVNKNKKTSVCKTSSSLEDRGEGAGEKHVLVCVLPQQATTYESVSWITVMTDSDPPLRRVPDVGPEPSRALSPAGTGTMLNILNCTDITGNYPSEKHMIHSQQKCGHRKILSNLVAYKPTQICPYMALHSIGSTCLRDMTT